MQHTTEIQYYFSKVFETSTMRQILNEPIEMPGINKKSFAKLKKYKNYECFNIFLIILDYNYCRYNLPSLMIQRSSPLQIHEWNKIVKFQILQIQSKNSWNQFYYQFSSISCAFTSPALISAFT